MNANTKTCPVCGAKMILDADAHYVVRDDTSTGLAMLAGGHEPQIYDAVDCPECGCQVILGKRKRPFAESATLTVEEMDEATARYEGDINDAMQVIGVTAKTPRGGEAETAQMLRILEGNGIKGTEAGRRLKTIILAILAPSKENEQRLESLGVNIYGPEEELRSMKDIFMNLRAAADGIEPEKRSQTLTTLFNSRNLAAINALLDAEPEKWDYVEAAKDESDTVTMTNEELKKIVADAVHDALVDAQADKLGAPRKGWMDVGRVFRAASQHGRKPALGYVGTMCETARYYCEQHGVSIQAFEDKWVEYLGNPDSSIDSAYGMARLRTRGGKSKRSKK